MAKKKTAKNSVESLKHKDKRKNIPTAELQDFVKEDEIKPKNYDYDPHPAFLNSTSYLPFKLGKEKRIAVKVIDHRGNEVMVVREVG